MLKTIRPRPWVCRDCLRSLSRPRSRRLSAVAEAQQPPPTTHATSHAQHDDAVLRQIFDSSLAWKDFQRPSASASASYRNVGLFRNAYLTSPRGFLLFARRGIARAQRIVDKILAAETLQDYRYIVQDLDRLSDVLCRVLDMADFVRVTHPDAGIQNAASEAWAMVYQYMNTLNTTTGLNDQLGKAMANPEIAKTWNEEEKTVAEMLRLDFVKSAVNLPKAARERFVQLSQRISEVGSSFMENMSPEQAYVTMPSSKLNGLNPVVARKMTRRGIAHIPALGIEASAAMRSVTDEGARRELYLATRTASLGSVRTLEEMLKLRADLAQLSGFESYGHMALHDRMMAKSPESVQHFLEALVKSNGPAVLQERQMLEQAKQQHLGSPPQRAALQPWDREFYAEQIRQAARSRSKVPDFLSSYFSVGTVMQGLSRLFSKLYGIHFAPRETLNGETWHPDVRRLDVVSDTEGHVAVLYCDLFYRSDKSPNPAHFTVRCSRQIREDEVSEVMQDGLNDDAPHFDSPEAAANDGMSVSRHNNVLKQLPTIALVCDFPQSAHNRPALLSYQEFETLYHEMGHAIHSVLARTSLQNVAGTRCATDLAELPSTLMEYFAADPAVLALSARHWETDEPLPYDMVRDRLKQSRLFEAADTENQILLAMLDQTVHSPAIVAQKFDSTAIFHSLQREYSHMPPDPEGTRWQGFFGHLFGYGATYYSYLFDRVLAERVWKVVFDSGNQGAALSRERGEHLQESLLKWGGGRDPWLCVGDALRDERIAQGDDAAMAIVGSWGTDRSAKA
jgi:mitochondrial intermediate peptidase